MNGLLGPLPIRVLESHNTELHGKLPEAKPFNLRSFLSM
jgi:hypothetical protein